MILENRQQCSSSEIRDKLFLFLPNRVLGCLIDVARIELGARTT